MLMLGLALATEEQTSLPANAVIVATTATRSPGPLLVGYLDTLLSSGPRPHTRPHLADNSPVDQEYALTRRLYMDLRSNHLCVELPTKGEVV